MTKSPNFGERYAAHARALAAKERMDEAIAALEKAEDEWHQACLECDRLDGQELPDFREMRGILKPR
jgi:hypothetical protein